MLFAIFTLFSYSLYTFSTIFLLTSSFKSLGKILCLIWSYTALSPFINNAIIAFSLFCNTTGTSLFSFFATTLLFFSSTLFPILLPVCLFISAYIASFDIPYSLDILSIYISCSILLSVFCNIFAVSFKNLILSFAFSKFRFFFNTFTLNSTKEIAFSTNRLNLPFPYFITYSSGSFAPSICRILTSQPIFFRISSPLSVAACPAPSESYDIITFSEYFLRSRP